MHPYFARHREISVSPAREILGSAGRPPCDMQSTEASVLQRQMNGSSKRTSSKALSKQRRHHIRDQCHPWTLTSVAVVTRPSNDLLFHARRAEGHVPIDYRSGFAVCDDFQGACSISVAQPFQRGEIPNLQTDLALRPVVLQSTFSP